MKNLYQQSDLLSKDDFKKIQLAFYKSWTRETAFPEVLKDWTPRNKALGQCAITAIIIFDLFGGRIIYDKENFHLWNELPDGTQHDFSRSQFKDKRIFKFYKYKLKEDILMDETGIRTDANSRYLLLKQRFTDHYKSN